MLRFILGTLASIGVVALVITVEGGSVLSYLILSALAIALLVPFFAILAVWPFREWATAWKDALSSKGPRANAAKSVAIWDFAEKASWASGIIGFICGLVMILSQLRTPSALGPSVAASLTCPLYAVISGLVCRILRARVENAQR
jgi:flagellar motor component MotA